MGPYWGYLELWNSLLGTTSGGLCGTSGKDRSPFRALELFGGNYSKFREKTTFFGLFFE